ncbi:hypothetical protein WH47_12634, partial [Habropoda laboriosa]
CLDGSVSESLPQHQSPQQVVCPTSASSPFILNSPVSHEHTTPQSVYQTTGSSSSLDSLNSQLYPQMSSPIDSSESHHQSHQLHTSSPISYPEYIQRNNE